MAPPRVTWISLLIPRVEGKPEFKVTRSGKGRDDRTQIRFPRETDETGRTRAWDWLGRISSEVRRIECRRWGYGPRGISG